MVEPVAYCPEAVGSREIMNQTFDYPLGDRSAPTRSCARILSVGAPHVIVLFGSQARGDARPDSDLDLLIIEDSGLPRYKRSVRYLRALVGLFPAKDVVVWTLKEVQEWAAVPMPLSRPL